MSTINLSVRYRPVRIGFLVRPDNVGDVVSAAELNSLLWGGIRNPIIPVAQEASHADSLVDLFSVDVLIPVTRCNVIDGFVKGHSELRAPEHYAESIFHQHSMSPHVIPSYLDVLNLIDAIWEKDIRHMAEGTVTEARLVKWDESDELTNLFALMFGRYPRRANMNDDFEAAYKDWLLAQEYVIAPEQPVSVDLADKVSPITLTGMKLEGYGRHSGGGALYLGHASCSEDLIHFWNLRAAGKSIAFVPLEQRNRMDALLNAHVARLEALPNRWPAQPAFPSPIYCTEENVVEARSLALTLASTKSFVPQPCDELLWNGLNVRPTTYYLSSDNVLASVEKQGDLDRVVVGLPGKRFLSDDSQAPSSQYLAASINVIGRGDYPSHTLIPPHLRRLNAFYSREIAFLTDRLRSEEDGLAELIQVHETYLWLYPLSYETLIVKIFDLAGIQADRSQPGLILSRILEKLSGLGGCHIFKLPGVRSLLRDPMASDGITKGEALKLINDGGNLARQPDLEVYGHGHSHSAANNAFENLLERDIFRVGLELTCGHCNIKNWLSLKRIDDLWACEFCGHDNRTSMQLMRRPEWCYRKSGLFAKDTKKDDNQEGAIPVILTLLTLQQLNGLHEFIWCSAQNLKSENVDCETDFCVIQHGTGDEFEVLIGECKSDGGYISSDDISKLRSVHAAFKAIGISCRLVFAKTASGFNAQEIALFQGLMKDGIRPILLTNQELERYRPYREEDGLPVPHPHIMEHAAANSAHRYLGSATT